MTGNYLIKLEEITFGYNGKPLLFDSLNFFLSENARVGIIGPNGSGKTTLFNIIMGFVRPVKGTIEIAGELMKNEKDFQKARHLIGYLFQNSDDQLFCPSVKEEIAFGPLNYRLPKEEIEKRVKEVLELTGLKGFEDRAPYELSEGEKKRVAFAAILAMKPKILLLDEPTNGIDSEGVMSIEKILRTGGYTYVIISQDTEFLKKTTNKIYTIEKGRLKEFNFH
ncbi:MAG: energy-coupling factor ABC transporter ATP-binding protein [candidate division WOR-3 bacterium]|nr:energy-coupling factor ABC transporter ATP-binding protein [candidate division WOR-3 bacterium]